MVEASNSPNKLISWYIYHSIFVDKDNGDAIIGADAVAVETVVIALIALFMINPATDWEYFWVFRVSLGLVIAIMLVRVMAGTAEDPNIKYIDSSIRWSSAFLQLAIIGTIAVITIHIEEIVGLVPSTAIFTILALGLFLSLIIVDELILGEFLDTWDNIVREGTQDDVIGRFLRNTFAFAKGQVQGVFNDGQEPEPTNRLKAVSLMLLLLSLLFVISIPISVVLSEFFGGVGDGFLIVLSLLFIRDSSRYIYINYGAAKSFSDLKWRLRWEFVWFIFRGAMLAGVLGYTIEILP